MSGATIYEQADVLNSDRHQAFLELAKRMAGSEEPTAEVIADILRDAGHDSTELRQLVAALCERRRIREKIATIPQLKNRQSELRQSVVLENSILETAIRVQQEKCQPIQRELFDLEKTLAESSTWESQLRLACPDKSLCERLKVLESQSPFLRAEVTKLLNEQTQIAIALRDEPHNEKLTNAFKRTDKELSAARAADRANFEERERIAKLQIEF